jgi:hypothetical protein
MVDYGGECQLFEPRGPGEILFVWNFEVVK